ncbi:MAG: cytochrome c oxidase subunit II [Planctomycetota bacterium]|nr:cytochrome c oxidase subunit II [Planctomycetota bacterium]
MLLLLLSCLLLGASEPPPTSDIDRWVSFFNPDLYALAGRWPATPIVGAFDAPASDIARDTARATWLSLAVFLPFLVLPQVLLVWIIWKFRDRGDGRRAATFVGNHTLEIVWTAIPIIALVIVSVAIWDLVVKTELPPADQRRDMVVEVRGKSFAWDYKYQRLGGERPTRREDQIEIGQDVAGLQEPLVLVKGRRVILNLTSNDVLHAWWVPAFGVKKDTIKGRYTHTWFTPERTGFFKGQCAELCGQGHGIMLISALVVEEPEFALWVELQRRRAETVRTWTALAAREVDPAALDAAVTAYLERGADPWRLFALRYWMASNLLSWSRRPNEFPRDPDGTQATWIAARRALLEEAIARWQARGGPSTGS